MEKTIRICVSGALFGLIGLFFTGCGNPKPVPQPTYEAVNPNKLEHEKGVLYRIGPARTVQICERAPISWENCESGDTIYGTKLVCRDTTIVTLGPSVSLQEYADGDTLYFKKAESAAANAGTSKGISYAFLHWIRGPQAGDGLTNALLILLVLLVAALLFTIIHDWLRARSHPRQRTTESPDTDVTPVPHKVHCHQPCWYQTPPQEAKGIRLTHKTKDGDTFEVKIDGSLPGPFVVTHEKEGKKETLSFGHLKDEEG